MGQRVKDSYFRNHCHRYAWRTAITLSDFCSLVFLLEKKYIYILTFAIDTKVYLKTFKSHALFLTEKRMHNSVWWPKVRLWASVLSQAYSPLLGKAQGHIPLARLFCFITLFVILFSPFFSSQVLVRCQGDGCDVMREQCEERSLLSCPHFPQNAGLHPFILNCGVNGEKGRAWSCGGEVHREVPREHVGTEFTAIKQDTKISILSWRKLKHMASFPSGQVAQMRATQPNGWAVSSGVRFLASVPNSATLYCVAFNELLHLISLTPIFLNYAMRMVIIVPASQDCCKD